MFMKKKSLLPIVLAFAFSMIAADAQTTFTLNPLSSFGSRGDGSIQPGDSIGTSPRTGNNVQISAQTVQGVSYGVQPGDSTAAPISTNGFNMRGLSYDPISGNLVFVDTHAGSGGTTITPPNAAIYILDPNSGNIIGTLSTNGITSLPASGIGTFTTAGVADDGAVYVAGQINAASNGFKIYRWPSANTNSPNFNEAPSVAFNSQLVPNERVAQTLDVRGSGTNTQIIIGSSSVGAAGSTTGTNIFLFTTLDGTNFTAHVLNFAGITNKVFNDGIAFGAGNTFFTKQVGQPLYYLSFDPTAFTNNVPSTNTGTVIASFTASSVNDPLLNISAISVDITNHLLAGLEEIGGIAAGGRGRVWLYDFSDPTNRAPSILTSIIYTPNFTKATAPMGYLDFGGGRLYANVVNNGLVANTVDSISLAVPAFLTDLIPTNRVGINQNAHFEVFAARAVTNYQWYSNNVAIPGANTYFIDIPNVQTNNSGTVYKVIASNAAGSSTSVESVLSVVNPGDLYHLVQLWSLGDPEGFMSATGGGTPPERTIAYNSLSNQLLVVKGNSPVKISVVNPDTGTVLYTLRTDGIVTGTAQTILLAGIGVADDGAVYAANVAQSDNSFKVYRWADTGPTTLPQIIFGTNSSSGAAYPDGNPVQDLTGTTHYRFGDNLAVRGSGVDTEIVLDNQNISTKYVAILRPTDNTMTNWGSTGYLLQNTVGSYGSEAYGTAIGRSLQFGPIMPSPFGDVPTFWQKRYSAAGAPLAAMGYTPGGGISPLIVANTSLPLFTNGSVGISFPLGLAASVSFATPLTGTATSADQLNFYDISSPSQAVLLSITPFKTALAPANNNAIAQVTFGFNPLSGSNYLFALAANSGAMGFVLQGGITPPPRILTQPKNLRVLQGTTASLNIAIDQLATIKWFTNGVDTGVRGTSYGITNAQLDVAGDYFAIATNVNGSVTSLVAHVSVALTNDSYTLSQAWAGIAGNPSYPYVTTNGGANTPNERSFAYNSVSNQLIVVRCPPSSTAYTVWVVDAATGNNLYTLDTTGVIHEGNSEVSGSNPIDLVAAAVADDGAIYICSETPNASGGSQNDSTKKLHVFRWANSGATTTNTLVYEGDPSGQPPGINLRWGDAMTARGSGTNTELILNSHEGSYGAILKPIDATMAAFTNSFFADSAGSGSIGRSLQFGTNNTVFEKRKGAALFFSGYDLTNQTSSLLTVFDSSPTLGGVAVDSAHNLVAGVDFVGSTLAASPKPDAVALYDIFDPTSPMLIARYNFPANQVANANFICQTVISGSRVYALDANNGLMAFNIVPPASSLVPPTLQIAPSGGNVILSWTDGSFLLESTPTLSPASWTTNSTVGQTNFTNAAAGVSTFYRLHK
jgi:hypothetical protein